MTCPVRAFDGRHRIGFRRIPFFLRTGSPRGLSLLRRVAKDLDPGICRTDSRRHGCLRVTTIFTYGFDGRVCTVYRRLLRTRRLPFRSVLPLVSRATQGMRRLSPIRTRANPSEHCSRGIVGHRLGVLRRRPGLTRVCQLLDRRVRLCRAAGR